MRTSAKLNLFLGVRNLSEAFLPAHLAYLESFFRRRAMNALFPFTVAASSAVLVAMVAAAMAAHTTPTEVLRLTLVGTLLAMAIVEHAMLVLPLSTTALWRWAMGSRKASTMPGSQAPAGPASATDTTATTQKTAPRAEAAPPLDHDGILHAR
jgi:hypothetical protein